MPANGLGAFARRSNGQPRRPVVNSTKQRRLGSACDQPVAAHLAIRGSAGPLVVLCTVDDPPRAAAEARRVLVEGGRFLYLEHVRSSSPRLAWWQDRLERPWGFFAGGCHPNRATDQLLAGAGFWIDHLERGTLPKAPPLARPLIRGVARRPSGADD